jgi:hypothetical protein
MMILLIPIRRRKSRSPDDAIRRATGARNDGGTPLRRIDAVYDRSDVVAFRGRGRDDVARPGTDAAIEIFSLRERAGALEHDVHVKGLPRRACGAFSRSSASRRLPTVRCLAPVASTGLSSRVDGVVSQEVFDSV